MFSCLRSQNKKAPKFCRLINITRCPFNIFLHKEISHLRSNKFDNETNFLTHLIHFLFQNLKEFLWVSIHSVSKTQHSNGTISSYRLISKVISAKFHTTEWHTFTADVEVLYFLHSAESAISHSPLLGLCHDNRKIVSGGQKPILAVPWPAWACVWRCWHVAAHLPFQLPGTRRKLRQPITFEEV
jgi:hypothetical protein